ncbi:MAG: type II secretion system protein N [Pseudomonadota bacterium]|nr:type II secretion system protein N [Pseudomonadota bacterium]
MGICLVAIALATRAPASLAAARLERLTDARLSLVEPEGTLWQGRGVIAAGEQRLPIAWTVHPASLLRGEVALTVHPGSAGARTPRGEVRSRDGTTQLQGFSIELPASALIAAAVPLPAFDTRGVISITTHQIEWPPTAAGGAIEARWRDAAIGLAGTPPVALGEVAIHLAARKGELRGPVTNTGGDFAITGELTVRGDGSGTASGLVRPRRLNDPRLGALLAIGSPEDGGVRLQWRWPAR